MITGAKITNTTELKEAYNNDNLIMYYREGNTGDYDFNDKTEFPYAVADDGMCFGFEFIVTNNEKYDKIKKSDIIFISFDELNEKEIER